MLANAPSTTLLTIAKVQGSTSIRIEEQVCPIGNRCIATPTIKGMSWEDDNMGRELSLEDHGGSSSSSNSNNSSW